MNWRFLLLIVVSVGVHLTLLAIQFQPNDRVAVGGQNSIGLVSDSLAQFSPIDTRDQSDHSIKQGPAPRQPQKLSPVLNIPSPLSRLSKAALTTAHDVVIPVEVREVSIAEEVSLEPVSPKPLKKIEISNVEVQNSSLAGRLEVAPVASLKQDESRTLLSEGVGTQVPVLTHAFPRYAENPKPLYPDVARRKGWTGEVRLLVLVDEEGDVGRISIGHSSGYSALDRAARRAVRQWRFVPATKKGYKVASEVVVPIDFRLPVRVRSATQ